MPIGFVGNILSFLVRNIRWLFCVLKLKVILHVNSNDSKLFEMTVSNWNLTEMYKKFWIYEFGLLLLKQYRVLLKYILNLHHYLLCILNILFEVMVQRHNRHMSFSLYISALAVSDTVALLIGEYRAKNNYLTT